MDRTTTTTPRIVLVHGAWADRAHWQRVIPPLEAAGCAVTAVQNSLTSLTMASPPPGGCRSCGGKRRTAWTICWGDCCRLPSVAREAGCGGVRRCEGRKGGIPVRVAPPMSN